jgi:hypothetical protein
MKEKKRGGWKRNNRSRRNYTTHPNHDIFFTVTLLVLVAVVAGLGIFSSFNEIHEIDSFFSYNFITGAVIGLPVEDSGEIGAEAVTDQVAGWNKTYTTSGGKVDTARGVAIDSNDNVFVVGYAENLTGVCGGMNCDDTWLKKFNSTGGENITNWNHNISNIQNQDDKGYGVAVNSNNSVFIVGYGTNLVSASSGDDWIIKKYWENGSEDLAWNLSATGAAMGGSDQAYTVDIDTNDNVYVAGFSNNHVSPSSGNDWWIKKFDKTGAEDVTNWNKTFNSEKNKDDEAYSVHVDSNDSIYVVGQLFNASGTCTASFNCGDWMIKQFNASGAENTSWNHNFSSASNKNDFAYGVSTDSARDVYVVGYGYNLTGTCVTSTCNDWWVKKFDLSGTEDAVNWNKNYSSQYLLDDEAKAVAVDSNDVIFVTGYGYNLTADCTHVSGNCDDWWVKKFNTSGTENLSSWNLNFSMATDDVAYSIAIDSANNISIVGDGTHLVSATSSQDWWIKKIEGDSLGTVAGSSFLLSACGTLDTANQEYNLTANVSAAGTCFTIAATGTTLNCKGFGIEYGSGGAGSVYGVNIPNYNGTTIKDCIINETNDAGAGRHGVFINGGNHSVIQNNTINTIRPGSVPVSIDGSGDSAVNNTVTNNTLNGSVLSSGPEITGTGALNNTYKNNLMEAATQYAFVLRADASNNLIENNVMIGLGGVNITGDGTDNNTLLNNNITATSAASKLILDETSDSVVNFLIYNNTFGEIKWVDNGTGSFLRNMTLNDTRAKGLIFGDEGNIHIGSNVVALNTSQFYEGKGRINGSANITLKSLTLESATVIKKLGNYTTDRVIVDGAGINCAGAACGFLNYSGDTLVFNVSSFSTFTADDEACGFINENRTLTANITNTTSCFHINASNIGLDCAGYNVTFATDGTGGYGVNNTGFDNVTIENCLLVEGNATTSNKNPIYLSNAESGLILNNTITTVGSSPAIDIRADSHLNNVSYNNFTNAASNAELIKFNANQNMIYANQFTAEASTAIEITAGNHNLIIQNNITTNGASGHGVVISEGPNTIESNIIIITGDSATGINMASDTNNITGNNITTSGESSEGIFFDELSASNRLVNNNISAEKSLDIEDFSGLDTSNFLIYNNSFGQIKWTNDSDGFLTNLTLNVSSGQGGLALGRIFHIGSNVVAVNDSSFNTGTVNTSANVSLFGLTLSQVNEIRRVNNFTTSATEVNDSGTDCLTTTCSHLSYAGGNLVFNTTSFSSFTTHDGASSFLLSACTTLNTAHQEYNLTVNVSGANTCMTISANNVTLNCKGFGIEYGTSASASNYGVIIQNYNETKIKDCIINETNDGGTSRHGIYINGGNHSVIQNNTINTIRSGSVPISIDGSTDGAINNTVTNNTLNASVSSSGPEITGIGAMNNTFQYNQIEAATGYGIVLQTSASYNLLESNVIIGAGGINIKSDGTDNNTLLNNNITATSAASKLILDETSDSVVNFLIYNNTFGEIKWVDNGTGSFLRNMTLNDTRAKGLIFGDEGNINISNNTISFNTSQFYEGKERINSSVNITLKGIDPETVSVIKRINNYTADRTLLDDGGNDCVGASCEILTYSGGTLVFNTSSFSSFTAQTACGKISTDKTLTENINSTTTCFTINAPNIVLDCNYKNITYGINGSSGGYAVDNTAGHANVTVQNCLIVEGNHSSDKDAIVFTGGTNATIKNNNITTYGGGSEGIDFTTFTNSTIESNNITVNGTSIFGVILTTSIGNVVKKNYVNSTGTGIYAVSGSDGNVIAENIVTSIDDGIAVSVGSNNTLVENNTIIVFGNGLSGQGVRIWGSFNTSVKNNTITTYGNSDHGVDFQSGSGNNTAENNVITTSGSSAFGVYFSAGVNNTFKNGNITSTGANAVQIDDGNGTVLNATFDRAGLGFQSGAKGNIVVKWHVLVNVTDTSNDPLLGVNITSFNSTGSTEQETTTDAAGVTRQELVEFTENSTIKAYRSPYQINASLTDYSPNNATSVTNLSETNNTQVDLVIAQSNVTCTTINLDSTLSSNLSSTSTCLTINASNIVVDCAGYSINYSSDDTLGYGINITGLHNVTIKDCQIIEGSSGTNDKHGILVAHSTNVTVTNTSIQMRWGSDGINIKNSTTSNYTRNTITTTNGNANGINCDTNCSSTKFYNNSITAGRSGFFLQSSEDSNVSYNYVNAASNAIYINGGKAAVRNRIEHNELISTDDSTNMGIRLEGDSNIILNNTITTTGTTTPGIDVGTFDLNEIINNTINTTGANSYGIDLGSDSAHGNIVIGNKINTTTSVAIIIFQPNNSINDTNTADGLPIYYNASIGNMTVLSNTDVSGTYGQIICVQCLNVTYSSLTMARDGISLFETDNSTIQDSIINTTTGKAIFLDNSESNNIIGNTLNTSATDGYPLELASGSINNRIINNSFFGSAATEILDDSATSDANYLIYNTSVGEIIWLNTSDPGFLTNLDVDNYLGLNNNLLIANNTITLNNSAFTTSLINTSAHIVLRGVHGGNISNIARFNNYTINNTDIVNNGTNCDGTRCTFISFDNSTGILTFNVSSFSSYTGNASSTLSPPVVTLNTPENSSMNATTSMTFNCSATDDVELLNLTLYGNWSGTWQANETVVINGTSNSTVFSKNIPEGDHVWNCESGDAVGQSASATANRTFTVDTISPAVIIVLPTNTTITNNASIELNHSTVDAYINSTWYTLDGGANISFTGNTTFNVGSEGSHTIVLYVNDSADNTNSSNVTFSYNKGANITINRPTQNDNASSLSLFINISTDETSMMWYSLDGNENKTLCTECTEGTGYRNVSDFGNHSIIVYANDTANNLNTTTFNFNLSADTDGDGDLDDNEADDDGDGINDDQDVIRGNATNVNAPNFGMINFTVNNSLNITHNFSGLQTINFTNGSHRYVEFFYNFTANQSLFLANVTIQKQNSTDSSGSIIVRGLHMTDGQNKTIYIDDINTDKTSVCIKDAEIVSVTEISSGCDGTNETKVACSAAGTTSGRYTCTDVGDQYKIDGVSNSGVIEVSTTAAEAAAAAAGGGGGGGGSSGGFALPEEVAEEEAPAAGGTDGEGDNADERAADEAAEGDGDEEASKPRGPLPFVQGLAIFQDTGEFIINNKGALLGALVFLAVVSILIVFVHNVQTRRRALPPIAYGKEEKPVFYQDKPRPHRWFKRVNPELRGELDYIHQQLSSIEESQESELPKRSERVERQNANQLKLQADLRKVENKLQGYSEVQPTVQPTVIDTPPEKENLEKKYAEVQEKIAALKAQGKIAPRSINIPNPQRGKRRNFKEELSVLDEELARLND